MRRDSLPAGQLVKNITQTRWVMSFGETLHSSALMCQWHSLHQMSICPTLIAEAWAKGKHDHGFVSLSAPDNSQVGERD